MVVCAISNQPWNSMLPTITLFPNCRTQADVNQIHARIITTGFVKNTSLTTKLILCFTSSRYIPLVQFARYVFFSWNSRKRGDPFLWNAMIKTYSHGNDPKQAIVMLSLMLENGVFVDKFSFSLALKACSRVGMIKEGMQIHGLMRKFDIGNDLFLQNCLICMYARCGCIDYARHLFDKMPERDSVSFNSMIDGYVKSGMIDFARELFDAMPIDLKNFISWNSVINGYLQFHHKFESTWELFRTMPSKDLISWNLMLNCCAKCGKMELALDLFNKMPIKDVISWANMIDGYAKLGRVDIARVFFDNMTERDVVSCNVMMAGYVQNGHCKEALNVFHDMLWKRDLYPDYTTLLITLSAVAQLGQIDEGIMLHNYLEENNFIVDGKLGVALIDMYAKSGSIENAMHVFEDIEEKIVEHWNAMIGGLAVHGMGEVAFDLFLEMERLSVKPDDITFIGVLNACGHTGMVKEGLMCFEIMRRIHNIEPKLQHYGCIVDILGRAGQIEEAVRFIKDMPIEPNDIVWRTLLGACRNHDNITIGERVAECLICMDPRASGSYVLLSNMYASFGMWDYVRCVRTLMKQRELEKLPGCSWIELEGNVHEFFVQDTSHPQVKEIYSSLDKWKALNSETCCRL